MATVERGAVERQYGRAQVLDAILRALADMGKDVTRLFPRDLALVDEFHIRGREATIELADKAGLAPGLRVLDVGCGLGGSARYLASERGCAVTGIDLTAEYVQVATALARLVGMEERTSFCRASAVELPFADGSFECVWTEHVQMNIADKAALYAEFARVLAPRGRLVFHDVFLREAGELLYPVPWAESASISFLTAPEVARSALEQAGFQLLDWEDKTRRSLEWFENAARKTKASGPPPLGLHIVMGPNAGTKVANLVRNLAEGRLSVIQAVAGKI